MISVFFLPLLNDGIFLYLCLYIYLHVFLQNNEALNVSMFLDRSPLFEIYGNKYKKYFIILIQKI